MDDFVMYLFAVGNENRRRPNNEHWQKIRHVSISMTYGAGEVTTPAIFVTSDNNFEALPTTSLI